MAQWVKNLTAPAWASGGVDLIPGLVQWFKGSTIAAAVA